MSPQSERFSWIGRACLICFRKSYVVRSLRASCRPAPRSLLGLRKHLLRNHFPPNCIVPSQREVVRVEGTQALWAAFGDPLRPVLHFLISIVQLP